MKHLLAVDDNEQALYFLVALLEGHGYKVETAHNGAEALEKARDLPPDLIISDILMPIMDGFTLCREWRADNRLSSIPFVFYTATYTDPRDEKLGLGLGADAFITKPAEPEDFIAAIRAVLEKYETEPPAGAAPGSEREEEVVFKQYNEVLIRKLEDKMLQLEKTNRALEQEIAAHTEAEESLRRQMACDEVVEELLSRIAGASASEIDSHIAAILQMIAEFMGADSAMVIEASEDLSTWGVAHGWASPALRKAAAQLTDIRMGTLPQIEETLHDGKTVLLVSPDDLPSDAIELRRLWEAQGVHSLLLVPFQGQGTGVRGCLALLSAPGGRTWGQQDIRHAEQMSKAIANAIVRKRVEDSLRENEGRLFQSQKMEAIGEMAGGIAHDFNNLLTTIIGYSDLIMGDAEPDAAGRSVQIDDVLDEMREIRLAAERARDLTNQILAFSRKQTLVPEVLVLNEVVAETKPLLERTLGEDLDLEINLDPGLGRCEADRHQFAAVLVNLALNARDSMPHGGKLTVESANVELDEDDCRQHPDCSPGPYVMLALTDTGLGISEDVREHIFEPFFTTKRLGQGTGLGLSMVYGVVKQSGGSIFVDTEAGRGTTFKIFLPRVDSPIPSPSLVPPAIPVGTGGETILVVEDEETVRTLVKRVLERYGYDVLAVENGAIAWSLLRDGDESIDLLLTDVVLSGELQGNELAEKVSIVRPELPILFMSGYTQDATVSGERLDAGANFLQKPFTAEMLEAKVRETLAYKAGAR